MTLFAALLGGTLVRIVALRTVRQDVRSVRLQSLRTWWILFLIFTVAVVGGEMLICLLLVVVAWLALREYLSLVGWHHISRLTAVALFAAVPIYYWLLLNGQAAELRAMAPIVFVLAIGGLRACLGRTEQYIRTTASITWGMLLFVYGISHAVMVMQQDQLSEPRTGSVGWFLFLLLLTECNDIMQAITGRKFGRHKITPRVSPNKTWQGLLGGIVTCNVLAVLAAPWFTTLTVGKTSAAGFAVSMAAGTVISVGGFLGDINMSAVKRDAGVKDGSQLLPGQGGMIDRIDSLTFTAPLFYYFVRQMTAVREVVG